MAASLRHGCSPRPTFVLLLALCCLWCGAGAASQERVTVAEVVFQGNKHFSAERLRELLGVQAGDVVSRHELAGHEQRVSQAYRQAGFPLVSVKATLDGWLALRVNEGPRVAVSDIVFEGNATLPDDELLGAMNSRARWWVAFLRPGRFQEDVFQSDIQQVRAFCVGRGFLDAQVGGYVEYSTDMTRVKLTVSVHEGRLYRLAGVSFQGNTLYRDEELLEATPFEVGMAYQPEHLRRTARAIAELYAAIGHRDVGAAGTLAVEPVVDPGAAAVNVRVSIAEGPQIRVGRIHIHGLTKTKENVVRRSLNIYPGQVATSARLRESEQLLINSGYFDASDPDPVQMIMAPGTGTVRDLIVRVKEGPTGNVLLGASVSEEGLMGEFSLVMRNFDITDWPSSWRDLWQRHALRGGGQKLSLMLRAGTKHSYYGLSFLDPAVGDGPYSLGFSAYSNVRVREDFDETRAGLTFTGGRALSKFVHHSLTVGHENVEIDDVDKDAPAELLRDEGTHSRPFLRYRTWAERRDNRVLPTTGHYLSAQIETAAGDLDTVRLDLEGRKYWTVREDEKGNRHVLGLIGRIGVVDCYGGDRVPVFERYFAGGSNLLRGFEHEGVAPIDPLTEDQIGGESMLVGSVEYSLPVAADNRLRIVLFSDFGYVQPDAEDLLSGWDDLRLSAGLGARLRAPILGPALIQTDLAFPIVEQRGDETRHFHFTIATGRSF
jgi:outer membrane protein insertion porin family